MKKAFLNKLTECYKNCDFQRYEIMQETDNSVIFLVAVRHADKHLCFEIVRVFVVGNDIEISIDKSIDTSDGTALFDSVANLIKTVLQVS